MKMWYVKALQVVGSVEVPTKGVREVTFVFGSSPTEDNSGMLCKNSRPQTDMECNLYWRPIFALVAPDAVGVFGRNTRSTDGTLTC